MINIHNCKKEIIIETKHHTITIGKASDDVWVKIDSNNIISGILIEKKIYLGTGSDSHSSKRLAKKANRK